MGDMRDIAVSIIVPHFNEPALLERLLRTIPNLPEIEVFVIDDHSTMNLTEYAACTDMFRDSNISFLKNDTGKKGAGTARNKGMKYARGKWLVFADADDRFLPDMWEHISAAVDINADVIYFSPIGIREDGKATNRHKRYKELVHEYVLSHTARNELRIRARFFSPCSKMVKRSFVESKSLQFDEILHSEDVMFAVRTGMEALSIDATENTIYEIRERRQSMTKKSDKAADMMRKKMYCKWFDYICENTSIEGRKYLDISLKSYVHKKIKELQVNSYEKKHGVL